jgi:hypothetical protein
MPEIPIKRNSSAFAVENDWRQFSYPAGSRSRLGIEAPLLSLILASDALTLPVVALIRSGYAQRSYPAKLRAQGGIMLSVTRLFALFLWAAAISAYAQGSSDSSQSPQTHPPGLPAAAVSSRTSGAYDFPDRKQQFRNFLYYTFGPPGLISTAIGAGIDQGKPAPPEWSSGAQGYGERYGWRFGMNLTTKTVEYSLGAATHEDVAYHRCDCHGVFPRSAHAFVSVLTARTPSGRTIFSAPSLVAPYAGSFTAVYAWYPNRYEPADAFRIGSMSFVFNAGGNLIGEFIAPRH